MKRRDLFLATIILIAAWQLLAMAIHRDTTTVMPTPLVVARTFVAVKMLHRVTLTALLSIDILSFAG